MEHLSREQIQDLICGTTGPAPEARQHLTDCPDCGLVAAEEAALEQALWEVRQQTLICPACDQLSEGDNPLQRCPNCGVAIEAGPYRVLSVLVQTGHSRLYLAENSTGQRVALKEIVFAQVPSADVLEAFEREAKVLKQLDHPQIPRLHESFQIGDGVGTRLYLAQDYVEGTSLLRRMEIRRFDENEVKTIAAEVLRVLAYLQNLSPPVFHRDIKPANLIRRPAGRIVMVDFGAARELGPTVGATLVGTYGYMPPEQLGGIIDRSTDLYALGASLVQLLTRRPPWQLLGQEPLARRVSVSRPFRAFLERMVAPEPGKRFASASEALDALGDLPRRSSPRRRLTFAALAATAIAVAAVPATIAIKHYAAIERGVAHDEALLYLERTLDAPQVTPSYLSRRLKGAHELINSNAPRNSGPAASTKPGNAAWLVGLKVDSVRPDLDPQRLGKINDELSGGLENLPPSLRVRAGYSSDVGYFWTTEAGEAAYKKGVTHLREGRPESAIKAFTSALQQNPEFFASHRGLALAYLRVGEEGKALTQLMQYRKAPLSTAARRHVDIVLGHFGSHEVKPAQAKRTGSKADDRAISRRERDIERQRADEAAAAEQRELLRLSIHGGEGASQAPFTAHEAALALNSAQHDYGVLRPRLDPGSRAYEATEAFRALVLKQYLKKRKGPAELDALMRMLSTWVLAIDVLESADSGVMPSGAHAEQARALYKRGNREILGGRFHSAVEQFQDCLRFDPGFADCHRGLGIAHARLGWPDFAVLHYRLYLHFRPQARDSAKVAEIVERFSAAREP